MKYRRVVDKDIGARYQRDKVFVGIKCLRADSKKKATSHNLRKWPPYSIRPHGRFCSLLHQKSCYKKSHGTEIHARTPRRNMVMRRGVVAMVEFSRGGLLHNECAVAIFFGGGCNNYPFGFQIQRLDLPFSIFCLNIFEFAVVVFCGVGGVQK